MDYVLLFKRNIFVMIYNRARESQDGTSITSPRNPVPGYGSTVVLILDDFFKMARNLCI